MAYRKSYYEQRMDEQARIREAVRQVIANNQEDVVEDLVEEVLVEDDPIVPDASWTKVKIQEWLDAEGIEYTASMNKSQLLELI